jgi:hypothetical protein
MSDQLPSSFFLDQAKQLVEEATKEGIPLRVMGSVAIRIHCPKVAELHSRLKRLETSEFTDIDFMTLSRYSDRLPSIFKRKGYERVVQGIGTTVQGFGRQIYRSSTIRADIFTDKLVMCHTIDLRDRIMVDCPTIPLADLLLEKMQIVEINMKDIKDTVVLVREHEVGDTDSETINARYIARLLSEDWGLYRTCMTNLEKIRNHFLPKFETLSDEDRKDVESKIDAILQAVERQPKSMKWKARSRIGTRAKWYLDVG